MSVQVVGLASGNFTVWISTPQISLTWLLGRCQAEELNVRIGEWIDDETEFEMPLDGRATITECSIDSENLMVEDESWWKNTLMELHSELSRCLGVEK